MPDLRNKTDSEQTQIVVTLPEFADANSVSRQLSRGICVFRVRGDLHNAIESKRLIELLRKAQDAMKYEAEIILQIDGHQLPPSRTVDPISTYLHPSALPGDIKQQILLAQSCDVEFVCLGSQTDQAVLHTLKSCLAACACSARILVCLEATPEPLHLESLLIEADGVLISGADFADSSDPNLTESSQRTVVKMCRQRNMPVYVCLHSAEYI